MEAFYSFNERFAKIRSKRIKKAIKGITGKTFPETDQLDQDGPSTSNPPKKKETSPSSRARPRGKKNNAGPRNVGNQDHKIGDPNNFADVDEVMKEHSNSSKKKIASPSGCSRGRGRRRMNVEHETTGSQEDSEVKHSSEVKNSTLSSDEDSHKRHSNNYNSEGIALRRSNRKRKQVTYMEDGHEADDNDVPMHQVDENDPSQAAADRDIAGPDAQSNLLHQDTSELNGDQIRTDPNTAEDTNEYPSGFELCEDQMDSAPKEYLFTGGGFCMEEGDEQDTAGDPSGTEMENGTSDACEDIAGFSDSGKSIGLSNTGECTENASPTARGASSPKRSNASRGSSDMQTLPKRRRKS